MLLLAMHFSITLGKNIWHCFLQTLYSLQTKLVNTWYSAQHESPKANKKIIMNDFID